jgi:hypothetical protein
LAFQACKTAYQCHVRPSLRRGQELRGEAEDGGDGPGLAEADAHLGGKVGVEVEGKGGEGLAEDEYHHAA